jgi:hypothetical protein
MVRSVENTVLSRESPFLGLLALRESPLGLRDDDESFARSATPIFRPNIILLAFGSKTTKEAKHNKATDRTY